MRKLLAILILLASINSLSQDVVGSRVIAKQSFFLKDNWVDSLRRGILNWQNDFRTLPTSGAVYDFVLAHGGSNTDSLFGVQDNLMAANRVVNMNNKVFRWDDVGGGFSANYHEQQIKDNGYIEYNIEKASTGVSVFESATPGSWAASATNAYVTQYFSVRANPSFEQGQFGNDWNQSGQWVDFLQEQYNDGTNGGSYWFQHREKWTGSTPFTSSLIMMDSLGLSMRTKKTIGSGHTGYKGILVDSNSNVRFENYPSTRNDGSITKALYISNASGDVSYGTVTPAESSIIFTDITTNNVSTSAHGFFPKLTSNSVYYVNNSGALTA